MRGSEAEMCLSGLKLSMVDQDEEFSFWGGRLSDRVGVGRSWGALVGAVRGGMVVAVSCRCAWEGMRAAWAGNWWYEGVWGMSPPPGAVAVVEEGAFALREAVGERGPAWA